MPTRRAPRLIGIVAVLLIAAACGGGTPAAVGSPNGSSAGTDEAPTAGGVEPSSVAASVDVDVTPSVAAGSPAAIDVCGLLATADIERITGSSVTATKAGPVQGIFPNGCEWTLKAESGDDSLILGVWAPGGRKAYDTYFAPFADENGDREVDGVGEAALYQLADSMVFVTGDSLAGVQWVTYPDAPDDKVIELARTVTQKLGG